MIIFNPYFSIRSLQNICLTATLILFSIWANAQNQPSNGWSLPRHQVNFMIGKGGHIDNFDESRNLGTTVVGMAYHYHLNRHFYTSIDYQFNFNTFDMVTQKRNFSAAPSPEYPLKVEVVNWQKKAGVESETKEPNLFELTNNEGFTRRQNVNLNVGFMRVTPRNILKLGVGYSHTAFVHRYVTSVRTNSAVLHTLNILETREWTPNIHFSYDFFLKQNLSIGFRANALMIPEAPLMGCLTVGYSPIFKNKTKNRPRV